MEHTHTHTRSDGGDRRKQHIKAKNQVVEVLESKKLVVGR